MNLSTHHNRHGISLLEVLISMGILTIGLVSVLSLIPAGRSQAMKAAAYDRGSALAANAAADFINRGFARPDGWIAKPSLSTTFVVFDPLYTPVANASPQWPPSGSGIQPKLDAATTASSSSVTSAGIPVADILLRSEDDILFTTETVGPDDTPVPRWSSVNTGRHAFEGTFSYVATLEDATGSWQPGTYATLTVVTFLRRDAGQPPVILRPSPPDGGGQTDPTWSINPTNIPTGMTAVRELIKPGSMVLHVDGASYKWYRVLMAADATNPTVPTIWKVSLTCEADASGVLRLATSGEVWVFPHAIGSLRIPIKLEGTSTWNN